MIISIKKQLRPSSSKLIPLQSKRRTSRPRLVVKDKSGWEIIPCDEIVRCEASGNYTYIHRTNQQHIFACMTLKMVETHLDSKEFVRTHQSHLVAINCIRRIESSNEVILSDGSSIPISRRKKAMLINSLQGLV